jgi:hypothetical protein
MEASFPNWLNSVMKREAASCFEMDVVCVQTYKSTQYLIPYTTVMFIPASVRVTSLGAFVVICAIGRLK